MIEIENLSVKLGDFMLDDINFKVNDGEFFIVVGPTGAGKSVIIETIAGMIRPDRGRIVINGADVTTLKPEKRNISICYQDYVLFPHMTVMDNINYGLRYKKNWDEEFFNRLINILKIEHLLTRYPENLSGGEKQRISLARALIVKPEVFLLDEPLAALDVHIKDRLMRDLKMIHSEFKMTVIMITHSFQEAFFLGDRGCVIKQGKLLQMGTMKEIFNHPNSQFVSDFVGLKNVLSSKFFKNIKTKAPFLGIRPENIIIKKEKTEFSIDGKIDEIANMGNYYEIIISSPIGKVSSMALFSDFLNSSFNIGDNVYFSFNEEHIQEIYDYN